MISASYQPIAASFERTDDRTERQDALAEEGAVHRPKRDALHVAELEGVDAMAGVAGESVG